MKNFLLLFVILWMSQAVIAQQDSVETSPKLILKWSPLSLAAFNPTFQFALEQPLKDRVSIQYELGYVSDFLIGKADNGYFGHGYRFRSELHYYKHKIGRSSSNRFIGPALFFKQIITKKDAWIARDGGTYSQKMSFTEHFLTGGIYGVIGVQEYKKNFITDFGGGLGVRGFYYLASGLPDDSTPRFSNAGIFGLEYDRLFIVPTLIVIVKFGKKIK